MKPYYQDNAVTIYHGDCREIAPTLSVDVGAIVTDPPYGIGYKPAGGRGELYARNEMAPVHGDDEPFDPTQWLAYPKVVLFGANHYADRLPASSSWFVWDKRDGRRGNWFADCELVWSNTGGVARVFSHYWSGGITASERTRKLHPTQKPVVVMRWLIEHTTTEADVILDPYMGSGPTLRAAKDLGRRAIGIEIEERYCEIAAIRCRQEVLGLVG